MSDADLARAEKILPPSNWPSDVWANRRKALEKEFEEVRREEREAALDLLERAWGLIANSYNGDWRHAPSSWQKAAAEWREKYHAAIRARGTG